MEDQDSESHLKIKEFLEQNQSLFTVIGVFAALSVYLSQLNTEESKGIQIGIAASLLLFLVAAAAGVFETQRVIDEVRRHDSFQSYLWVFPYSIILYGLMMLTISMASYVIIQFGGPAGDILFAALAWGSVVVYWTAIYTATEYGEEIDNPYVASFTKKSPILAVGLTLIWGYYRYSIGAIEAPMEVGKAELSGYLFGVIIVHLAFLFGILFSVLVTRTVYSNIRDSKIFSKKITKE